MLAETRCAWLRSRPTGALDGPPPSLAGRQKRAQGRALRAPRCQLGGPHAASRLVRRHRGGRPMDHLPRPHSRPCHHGRRALIRALPHPTRSGNVVNMVRLRTPTADGTETHHHRQERGGLAAPSLTYTTEQSAALHDRPRHRRAGGGYPPVEPYTPRLFFAHAPAPELYLSRAPQSNSLRSCVNSPAQKSPKPTV